MPGGEKMVDEPVKTLSRIIGVLSLFALLTFAFYYGFNWLDYYQDQVHRYDEPDGGAVKVFLSDQSGTSESLPRDAADVRSRVFDFIRNGE